jgi:hypothetical protein
MRQASGRRSSALELQDGEGGPAWSASCSVTDLFVALDPLETGPVLTAPPDWARRWTVSWRTADGVVAGPVRDVDALPVTAMQPVRRFTWSTRQRHRPGLQFMVSTGRHHGFESLAEQRLLLALDFAGGVQYVPGQPFRLRFTADAKAREHVPMYSRWRRTACGCSTCAPPVRFGRRICPGSQPRRGSRRWRAAGMRW